MKAGRKKGTAKTGGRQKGSLNKTTKAVKECVSTLLTEYANSEQMLADFATLEPKERLMIAEKLMNYVAPKMQSVAVEDVSKDRQSSVDLLIQLRDGNRDVIPNLSDSEDCDEK